MDKIKCITFDKKAQDSIPDDIRLKMNIDREKAESNIMRTRGKLLKKEIWFSICSRHTIYEKSCKMCNAGIWQNAIKYKISSLIYKLFPSLWRWWANR